METLDDQRRNAHFVDVVTDYGTLYRFPNDETGHARAIEYRNAYNESLRSAMGVTEADLNSDAPDFGKRPKEYDRAILVDRYYGHAASVAYPRNEQVISNDDPMPTDYPHGF